MAARESPREYRDAETRRIRSTPRPADRRWVRSSEFASCQRDEKRLERRLRQVDVANRATGGAHGVDERADDPSTLIAIDAQHLALGIGPGDSRNGGGRGRGLHRIP